MNPPRRSSARFELGINFFDTADVYGVGHNEELVGKALKKFRDRVLIATKFGNQVLPDGKRAINGRPEYVRSACDASLKRLGVDHIDLYYQHRVDKQVPIEETVGAMAELVRNGQGSLPRIVGGERKNDSPRARDPSDNRAPVGVLDLDPRLRRRSDS